MSLNTTATSDGKSGEETVLVISLSSLAFVLAPLTLASNILVIVPFCRFSRVRTASNQILLALAITDLLLGMSLCMASIAGLTKVTKAVELNEYLHLSYAVALSMATLQATSLMLMMANSVDKALSLLRPLHYNEIMTFTTVKVYIAFTLLVAVMVGVVVPVAFYNAWSDVPVIPFGPENPAMQVHLMFFFTLPCCLVVTFCHIYVYSVANRHAKAIKRDDAGVRDRMRMSEAAHYKMPTNASEAAVTIGPEAVKGNYLTIPMGINGTTVVPNPGSPISTKSNGISNNGITTKTTKEANGGRGDIANHHNNSYGNAASSMHRYGASLLLGVLVVFISRIPSQVWCFFVDQKTWNSDLQNQLFYVFANIPLFLCSALNPWMYAYHNLEMKPIMKRLLKRACQRVLRPHAPDSRYQSQNYRSSGFMTNWQVSVFATFPRRSSCHQSSHYRAGSSVGGGGVSQGGGGGGAGFGKISTSPSVQQPPQPPAASTRMSPSQSQTSALSRSISQVDYHHCQSPLEQQRRLQQQPRIFPSFVNYNRSKSYYGPSTATAASASASATTSAAVAATGMTVIPTVTVWDEDSTRLTKQECML